MTRLIKNQKGSLMIEAMVAISLAIVGLLGLLSLVIHSLINHQLIVNRLTAAGLAAEGVEIIRNLIDLNYASNRQWDSDIRNGIYELNYNCATLIDNQRHCERLSDNDANLEVLFRNEANPLHYSADGTYNYLNGQPTPFKRLIIVAIDESLQNQKIVVNSLVRWSDRGRSFTINIEDHFFNWRR